MSRFPSPSTIVALATPPGRGGLAVVRLSGPDAFPIATSLLANPQPLEPRRAIVAGISAGGAPQDGGGPGAGGAVVIDQAVVLPFAAPASYTGEDVVEFSLHGSMTVASEVIAAAVRAGAVLAGPGEFTLRAFLNGRLDLAQAEAVRDLVDAATPLQARVAFDQLTGTLSGRIAAIEGELFSLSARLEASIDFPDEGYRFVAGDEARAALGRAHALVVELLATAGRGRVIREGATVAIAGRPNVGKSSLFNRLVGADRAIVHEVPGTTRDMLTEEVTLGGLRLTLADTAGVRASEDLVEREGVARATRAHAAADLVLLVLDGSEPLSEEDRRLLNGSGGPGGPPRVVVVNKADLEQAWDADSLREALKISCRDGCGVNDLIRSITKTLVADPDGGPAPGPREAAIVTNARHVALLQETRSALEDALALFREDGNAPEDVVLSDVQRARDALEEVTGKRTTDDLLHEIFSSFCIGK